MTRTILCAIAVVAAFWVAWMWQVECPTDTVKVWRSHHVFYCEVEP